MSILKDDNFSRRGTPIRPGGRFSPLVFVLVFLSVALLLLSRLQHGYVREARLRLEEMMRPVLTAALVPLEPVRAVGRQISAMLVRQEELERLRVENQKLRGWEWRARELERKLAHIGRLAQVVEEPGIGFITARVIADASGPFVHNAMLNAGRDHGLKSGNPVISADGLVGRIIESGRTASRLLLLTDLNSRIPVFVGRGQVRAVLMGDNSPMPRLTYLQANVTVSPGEEVYTSGLGGLFPRGLRIGVVADAAGTSQVRPHARLDQLEYVSVLRFDALGPEIVDEERVPPKPAAGRRAAVPVETR